MKSGTHRGGSRLRRSALALGLAAVMIGSGVPPVGAASSAPKFLGAVVSTAESPTVTLGRDGGFTVPLPNGKDLWIFADTPRFEFTQGKWKFRGFIPGSTAGLMPFTPGRTPTKRLSEIKVGHSPATVAKPAQFLPSPTNVYMPNGSGKKVRVAVFTQGANAEAAKAAGADAVGMDDLAARVKAGDMPFDVVIAAPDAMRVVGTLGQILGPRGLMPNPKVGTVTPDVAGAVRNAKAGQVRYRCDKAGIIHCTIGKASFEVKALRENLLALIADIQKHKPSTSKGVFLQRVSMSSTMGPGIGVDRATLGI